MTRTSMCIYHFLVLNWYIFLNYYISQLKADKLKSIIFQNGGQWKYLTFLNLNLILSWGFSQLTQIEGLNSFFTMRLTTDAGGILNFAWAIFYGVACLDDVLKRIKEKKDIKFITAFRDLLFTTLAFPISTFVFLSFWILFLYDRDLVYPKALDGIFPVWMNHAMYNEVKEFDKNIVEDRRSKDIDDG